MRKQTEQDGMAGRETATEGCTMQPVALEHRPSGLTAESPAEWIAEIQRHAAQETSSIIDLAIVICAARSKLHFGQWAEIWESERLPFGKRKAEKLDVVGKGLGWLDAIDRSHLPSALRTLYWLARLERATLKDLLADGTIHPGLRAAILIMAKS